MKLHDYQCVAVDHLHRHPRGALMLDMGLGKTAIVLSALTGDHLPVLVVAPKRVAEHVWPEERGKWRPDLSLALAAGPPDKRQKALRSKADITVIGRDNIADVPLKHEYRTVVLDELSGFRAKGTLRWKHARKIVAGVPYVWGLTGTPTPNGLIDLWAQIGLLDGGERLGKTLTEYRGRYFYPGRMLPQTHVVIEWLLREGAEEKIHALLDDICLGMSAEGRVRLPPVTYNTITVDMPASVRTLYKDFKKTLVADLGVLGDVGASNAAALGTKLSQIASGFLYRDGLSAAPLHSEKVRAVQEVIEGSGGGVLVFYRFREEAAMLHAAVPECVDITQPSAIEAWNRGDVRVLVAHPASAGQGLNLQYGGHVIVWMGLPWDLEHWSQGNARLARQGQTKGVVIHSVVARGTVDEAVARALETKTSVQKALLDYLESPL